MSQSRVALKAFVIKHMDPTKVSRIKDDAARLYGLEGCPATTVNSLAQAIGKLRRQSKPTRKSPTKPGKVQMSVAAGALIDVVEKAIASLQALKGEVVRLQRFEQQIRSAAQGK